MTVGFGFTRVQAGDDTPLAGRVLRLRHDLHRSIRFQNIIPPPHQAMENPPQSAPGVRVLPRFPAASRSSSTEFAAKTCAAVIPCFNEARTIAPLVAAVRQYLPLVMVVDDGSTDGTPGLARAPARCWSVIVEISAKAPRSEPDCPWHWKQGFEWALTLDGDGQHAPGGFAGVACECAGQTGASLVIGNRMHDARAIPWLRRQVNRWMSRKLSQLRRAGTCRTRNAVCGSSIWQPGRPCRSRRNVSRLNPKR